MKNLKEKIHKQVHRKVSEFISGPARCTGDCFTKAHTAIGTELFRIIYIQVRAPLANQLCGNLKYEFGVSILVK